MPITRSQSSNPPSDAGEGASRSEIESLSRVMDEKEKILKEQTKFLQERTEEFSTLLRGAESREARRSDEQLNSILNTLIEQVSLLSSLPKQVEILNQRISNQPSSSYSRGQRIHFDVPADNYSREHNPPDTTSPIRFKDVVDSIPKYDGHKMSVFHFSKICERALALIPQNQERYLAQFIINKLQGHAYSAVEGEEYTSVRALTRQLKRIFGPNKTVDQYRGELANIYMKPNENIFDYIARVKELQSAIIDGESNSYGEIDETDKEGIEYSVLQSFINGLPPDLLIRVKLDGAFTLEGTFATTIQLTKTLEAENARKRIAPGYRSNVPPRADFINKREPSRDATNSQQPPQSQSRTNTPFIRPLVPGQPGPNYPREKICRYCKNAGHYMEECRKLAYKRSLENNSGSRSSENNNSGNSQSVPTTSGVQRNDNQTGRLSLLPRAPVTTVRPQSLTPALSPVPEE